MDYGTYLSNLNQDIHCPFCSINPDTFLDETEHFYITLAKAPYVHDHLLVIPKKHVVFLSELSREEQNELWEVVDTWVTLMKKFHDGSSVLLRDTMARSISGKSINHLHVHIVPDCWIGALTGENGDDRKCYSQEEIIEEVKNLKEKLECMKEE